MKPKHILFLLLFSTTLFSRGADSQFNNISTMQGLSNARAKCIFQDSKGYMWFGTMNGGLNRYDGYSFAVYSHNPEDSSSIINNDVYSISEDTDGNLWIAVPFGLSHYIRSEDRFVNHYFQKQFEDLAELAWYAAYSVFVDSKNRVWVGTSDVGTLLYDQETETFTKIHQHSVDSVAMPPQIYGSFSEDAKGVIWASAGESGFVWYDEDSGVFRPAALDSRDRQVLQNQNVFRVYADSHNDIWIMTTTNLYKYLSTSQRLVHLLNYESDDSINAGQEGGLSEDANGNMWVVHSNLSSPVQFKQLAVEHETIDSIAMTATDVLMDSFGNLWVSDWSRGLYKRKPKRQTFHRFEQMEGSPYSLSSNQISALHQSSINPDVFYIGTGNAGLNAYNRKTGEIKTYFESGDRFKAVTSFVENKDGTLWIGFWDGGLVKFAPETDTFKAWFADTSQTPNLANSSVTSLKKEKDGSMWIGTAEGLFKMSTNENTLESIIPELGIPMIFRDENILWFTTYGAGLLKYDIDSKSTVYFRHESNSNSISNDFVWDIYKDKKGLLWLATANGLNRFDPSTQNFTVYKKSRGLPDNYIAALLPDNNGNLWLSTPDGISRLVSNSKGLTGFTNFDESDGLIYPNFQYSYAIKDDTGQLWFAGENGLYYFTPQETKSVEPKLLFKDLKVNGASLSKSKFATLNESASIRLKHTQNTISMEFLVLHYTQPDKNLYAHYMEGFDSDWIYNNERNATYINLKPGDYTLYFRGANGDGLWSAEDLALSIRIQPPWWKTWFAYFIYAGILLGLIWGTRRYELDRRNEKEKKRLLEVEHQRKSQELERARQLQLSMLPKKVPKLPNLEIAAYMNPATEVGGDYYDFHLSSDGTLTVAVGDATGHGMQAGMMVTATKSLFESLGGELDTVAFMNKANSTLKDMHLEKLKMAFTILKIRENQLVASGAGMPSLLIYRQSTKELDEITFEGMPLGSLAEFPYEEKQCELSPGDKIIIMSDGFPERQNPAGEMLDYPAANKAILESANKSSQEMVEALAAKGNEWAGGRPQDDDVTFVVIEVK